MEKKAKMGMSAGLILGIIFSVMGFCFLCAGIGVFFALKMMQERWLFLLIFGGVGFLFFVIGLIVLISSIRRKAQMNRVLREGHYITAEVFDIQRNYNVNINHRHPFIVRCRFEDGQGNVHIFKSRNIFYVPEMLERGCPVKVYVDPANYKHYYVDIDEVMPRVIEY